MPVVIERDGDDAYRYACPNGHTDWVLQGDTIQCRGCPHWKLPGPVSHGVLIDQKTGDEVDVSEVTLE